jgi:DNA polymerase sigma
LKSYRNSVNNNKIAIIFNQLIDFYDELEIKKNDEEIKKKLLDYLSKIIP